MHNIKQNLVKIILSFCCLFGVNSCQFLDSMQPDDGGAYVNLAILLPLNGPDAEKSQEYIKLIKAGLQETAQTPIRINSYDSADPDALDESMDRILASGADIIVGPIYSEPTKIVTRKVRKKGPVAISLSNNPALASEQIYVFGHAPMKQLQELIRHSLTQDYKHYITLLPAGNWSARTNQIIAEMVSSYNKKFIDPLFYDVDKEGSVEETVKKLSSVVDELNENDRVLSKPVVVLADDSVNLERLLKVFKSYQLDKKIVLLSDNRINLGVQDDINVTYTGSTNFIENNFLARAKKMQINTVSFMHVLAYDVGALVGKNIGSKYNRAEFLARMNNNSFSSMAAQETYFIDNIAQRKYQIIEKKGSRLRELK